MDKFACSSLWPSALLLHFQTLTEPASLFWTSRCQSYGHYTALMKVLTVCACNCTGVHHCCNSQSHICNFKDGYSEIADLISESANKNWQGKLWMMTKIIFCTTSLISVWIWHVWRTFNTWSICTVMSNTTDVTMVPTPPGKSWKMSFVLESPWICGWKTQWCGCRCQNIVQ